MAYPCDLNPALGTNDILRAIYSKIDGDSSSGRIEEKLDIITDQLAVVNNNIELNTKAIKDISINVDIHSKDIQNITNAINNQTLVIDKQNEAISKQTEAIKNIQVHIDTSDLNDSVQLVAAKVEDGFVKTVEAIKSIQPSPQPVPPCPQPHPHPPHNDVIFYPVPLGLPASKCFKHLVYDKLKPHYKRCECKPKEKKSGTKVFVPEEQRPNYETLNPYLCQWKIELYKRERKPLKIRYPQH